MSAEGFRPEPTVYKLYFDEKSGLDGLSVRTRTLTIAEFNQMIIWTSGGETAAETAKFNENLAQLFIGKLVSWNLLDPETGDPVPPTVEGFMQSERPLINKIIGAWQMAMVGIDGPLSDASEGGRTSEDLSLELVSESLSPQS